MSVLLQTGVAFCASKQICRRYPTQLQLYDSMNGTYPTTQQGLRALVEKPTTAPVPTRWYQLFREVPKDPWGHDYVYRSPAGITYEILSAGPDGVSDAAYDVRKF